MGYELLQKRRKKEGRIDHMQLHLWCIVKYDESTKYHIKVNTHHLKAKANPDPDIVGMLSIH